jgi:hypothetical protein
MLLGQNSNSLASIMRQAIVAGFGVEGFCFQELYRMITVKSVIGYRQLLRFFEGYMQLILFSWSQWICLSIKKWPNLHEI